MVTDLGQFSVTFTVMLPEGQNNPIQGALTKQRFLAKAKNELMLDMDGWELEVFSDCTVELSPSP